MRSVLVSLWMIRCWWCAGCGIGVSLRVLTSVVVVGTLLYSAFVRVGSLWEQYTAEAGGVDARSDSAGSTPPLATSTRHPYRVEYGVVAARGRVRHSPVRPAPCIAPEVVWRTIDCAGGVHSLWLWCRCVVRLSVACARCGARNGSCR